MTTDLRIEIVTFDGFDELDVFAPYEVLCSAGFEVDLVAVERPGPVRSQRGRQLVADSALGAGPRPPDGVLVPGGGWLDRAPIGAWAEAERGVLPAMLRELAVQTRWVASVCTGALLLGHAGLLTGKRATTNPAARPELRAFAGTVLAERVVVDGDVITAGAPGCGLDLGFQLVERELGRARAEQVARDLQAEAHLPASTAAAPA